MTDFEIYLEELNKLHSGFVGMGLMELAGNIEVAIANLYDAQEAGAIE
jgi:hypothetical protein